MKMKQKLLASAIAVTALAGTAMAPLASAEVEVSASVGAANMYYWRGFDLGNGTPAVWGDLTVSAGGFYGGMWTSSGDSSSVEYDLYVGYGGEAGAFTYDVSLWSYSYPSAADPVGPGELMEAVVGLGFGPLSLTYFHGLEDLDDYWYTTVGLDVGDFNFTYGHHEDDVSHLDVTYGYNENLSFTLGLILDDGGYANDEPKFIVSFTIPIN
ncbi:TorF family putative porin [Marinimicrobium sp. ABcell2]|uniref:TorF family putative porin n=1 Tax=Marinimicrobium sp. ABcell2 TaxID=3069751 RepID=UPI0027B2E1A3|nr:TorF family putative porin [Marinimicrobium sp. ABcell2]MDQ2077586.1 TorF family putative porin [Marinimicrobium sp. ABcell2]